MVGILWFDDSSQSLKDKVKPAVRRYVERFGRPPSVCYVHPSIMDGAGDGQVLDLELDGRPMQLAVRPRRSVLRYHLLVGEENDESKGALWSSSQSRIRKGE